MSVSDELDALPDDAARAKFCRDAAVQARRDFYAGMQDSVSMIVNSRAHQFDGLSDEARVLVGKKRWTSSLVARDLLDQEQLMRQWFEFFHRAAQSSAPRPGRLRG